MSIVSLGMTSFCWPVLPAPGGAGGAGPALGKGTAEGSCWYLEDKFQDIGILLQGRLQAGEQLPVLMELLLAGLSEDLPALLWGTPARQCHHVGRGDMTPLSPRQHLAGPRGRAAPGCAGSGRPWGPVSCRGPPSLGPPCPDPCGTDRGSAAPRGGAAALSPQGSTVELSPCQLPQGCCQPQPSPLCTPPGNRVINNLLQSRGIPWAALDGHRPRQRPEKEGPGVCVRRFETLAQSSERHRF